MSRRASSERDVMAALLGPMTAPPPPADYDPPVSAGQQLAVHAALAATHTSARDRYTTYLQHDLLEELRDAANHLSGHPHYLTIADIIEAGARFELERLRREHNNGVPFAPTERRRRRRAR